jgi:hypothetical protein
VPYGVAEGCMNTCIELADILRAMHSVGNVATTCVCFLFAIQLEYINMDKPIRHTRAAGKLLLEGDVC